MTAREFFALQPGEKVRMYWAKDDNPEYEGINGVMTVVSNDGESVMVEDENGDEYQFTKNFVATRNLWDGNIIDGCRGYVYVYEKV